MHERDNLIGLDEVNGTQNLSKSVSPHPSDIPGPQCRCLKPEISLADSIRRLVVLQSLLFSLLGVLVLLLLFWGGGLGITSSFRRSFFFASIIQGICTTLVSPSWSSSAKCYILVGGGLYTAISSSRLAAAGVCNRIARGRPAARAAPPSPWPWPSLWS